METEPVTGPGPRLRLWQLKGGYHCAVLGTCLDLEQTRRILARGKVPGLSRLSDHEVHCVAIEAAKGRGPIAKMLHKALDRAHAAVVKRYSRIEDAEALREAWRKDAAEASVEGAFWAVMSHPLTDDALRSEAFGAVHMMSHQVGHARRRELERARAHAEAVVKLEARLVAERERYEEREATLAAELQSAERRIDELTRALEDARAKRAEHIEAQLEAAEAARLRSEEDRQVAQRKLDRARARIQRLEAQLAERPEAPRAARPALSQVVSNEEPCLVCEDPCEDCDLRGGTILYVGGERSMLPHLRRRVADAGGELLHHDGGREDKLGALRRLCARADAVMCPVDRVGHAAIDHVKRACSSGRKTFLPLRRASIDAFEEGLRALAEAKLR